MSNFFTHIEHFEDYFLDYRNLPNLLTFARDIVTGSNITLNHKVDGNMMVIFGINKFNGLFFISTKSGVSKSNPRLIYCKSDIDKHYPGSDNLTLRLKLEKIFHLLKEYFLCNAYSYSILQCDVLFLDSLIPISKVNNKYSFTPNTITYNTRHDVDPNKYKLGICIHAEFSNESEYCCESLNLVKNEKYDSSHTSDIESEVFVCHSIIKHNFRDETIVSYEDIHNLLPKIDSPLCSPLLTETSKIYIKNKIIDYLHKVNLDKSLTYNIHQYIKHNLLANTSFYDEVVNYTRGNIANTLSNKSYANISDTDMRLFIHTTLDLLRIKYTIIQKLKLMHPCFLSNTSCSVGNSSISGEGWIVTYNGIPLKLIDRSEFSLLHFTK